MMKKFLSKNDGLTLVELMVAIAIGTMIFAATTTVLLLGFRIHAKTTDSIEQQYTGRMVITMLEEMAEEGKFDKIYRDPNGSWKLGNKVPNKENQAVDEFSRVILSYSSADKTIYSGDYASGDKTSVLENVVASYIILEGKLLTISLEDTNSTYTSAVYCRTEDIVGGKNFDAGDNKDKIPGSAGTSDEENEKKILADREKLLSVLNSQVGVHGGIINHDTRPCSSSSICGNRCHQFNLFSQWYINGYEDNPGWSTDTPWCGCFVSWGLCHTDNLTAPAGNPRWFANVDTFMNYFKKETTGGWKAAGVTPTAGDLIFFDMVNGSDDNPSHMGAVLSVKDGIVTTIEGNSADVVAIREYSVSDSRIIGYGDPWAAKAKQSE